MTFQRRQRTRQHEVAHGTTPALAPPMKHPLVPQGAPELLVDPAKLAEFLQHIRSQGAFAYDTEFIGEDSYRPKTCLIQVATQERVALIDPLAIRDLAPLWELIGDPATLTILHAGASDLSPARRHLRREPGNIIDVQVAAGFVGMGYPLSLTKLVEKFAGFPLEKGLTFTNWDARPLSGSQVHYAADDVRYLPLVWHNLRTELEQRGRMEWAVQETGARLGDPHVFDASIQMLRTSGSLDLTPPQRKLIEALCIARDRIAQLEDLPYRTTMPDGALLEIARERPRTKAALDEVRGLPRPIVARHGDLLLQTLSDNPSEPTIRFAVKVFRGDRKALKLRSAAMLAEAEAAGGELGIAPMLAVTRADVEDYVRRHLEDGTAELFGPSDWRRKAFGDRIERAGKKRS